MSFVCSAAAVTTILGTSVLVPGDAEDQVAAATGFFFCLFSGNTLTTEDRAGQVPFVAPYEEREEGVGDGREGVGALLGRKEQRTNPQSGWRNGQESPVWPDGSRGMGCFRCTRGIDEH